MLGQIFGRLKVISESEPYISPKGHSFKKYLCLCSCGKSKSVRSSSLRNGGTISCGCAMGTNFTHNLSKHRLYSVYHDMVRRCTNSSRKDYKHYGGRGITVCQRWLTPVEGIRYFIEDMFPTFVEGLELERKDVNGNYCPENCTWVTRQVQVINRRPMDTSFNAKFIEYDNKILCISQWAEETGIPSKILVDRLGKLKWPVEKSLTFPLKVKAIFIDINGTRFKFAEAFKLPPTLYAIARKNNKKIHQFLADMFYNRANVVILSSDTEVTVEAKENSYELLGRFKLTDVFSKTLNGVEL